MDVAGGEHLGVDFEVQFEMETAEEIEDGRCGCLVLNMF